MALAMHEIHDQQIGFASGAIGGFIYYVLNMPATVLLLNPFIVNLFQAAITATLCGFLGVAGKQLFASLRKWYLNRKNKVR